MNIKVHTQLDYLQSMRAIAAVMVCIGHIMHEMVGVSGYAWVGLLNDIPTGIFVDIFFLISGFIMMHTTMDNFGSASSSKNFAIRRLTRVLPTYWIFTSLIVAVALIDQNLLDRAKFDFWHVLQSYFFIPHFDPNRPESIHPILALGWTLNYEMFFYVVFAIGLLFSKPVGLIWTSLCFMALFVAASVGFITGAYGKFFSNSIIFEFLLGIALYFIVNKAKNNRFIIPLVSLGALILWAFGFMLDLWSYRLIGMGLPAIVMFFAIMRLHGKGAFPKKIFNPIGDASYAIYLAHPFVLTATKIAFFKVFPVNSFSLIAYLLVTLVAILVFSIAFFYMVEKPLGKWLNAALLSRRQFSGVTAR